MYNLTNYPIINVEPWNIDFEKRLKSIYLSNKNNRKNVIYVYEKSDTSTFRYRAYNMCQALIYSDYWNGNYFFENEVLFLEGHLDKIDIVVIVRTRWSLVIDRFINNAKKRRITILFDIDDLVYSIKSLPLIVNTLNVDFGHPNEYENWFTYVSRLYLTGTLCDGTIGTNEYLSQKLKTDFEKPNYIINNFINNEQKEISDKLFREKKNLKRSKPFVIGYFSGTPSHFNDFKKVALEIRELLDSYPDIILKVIGFIDFPEFLNKYKKQGRIIHEQLVDFLTLQQKIAEADVNIVPLVENEFTNCKSELKFFEAAIVGTITCATPTYTLKKNIQNGVNGYLCNEGEWYSTIESIYMNRYNEDIIKNAYNYCINKYSPEVQSKNIENIFESLDEGSLSKCKS